MKYLKALVLVLIAAGLVAIFAWVYGKNSAPTYQINANSAAIIKQLQEVSKLETATYTVEKVIDAGTSGNAFSQFLFGDQILLIAHGDVVAGFDFAKMAEKNISVEGAVLRLQLPAPEILSATLDNSQTRVYDRKLGLLTKGNPTLESTARAAAVQSIRLAACQADILGKASDNAGKVLSHLFEAAGFKSVQVMIPDAPNCQ